MVPCMTYMGVKNAIHMFSRTAYMIESLCLVCVSPAIAVEGSSHAPPICVMLFVGSMVMVTISHLMIRGLISMDSVNTHSSR